MFGYVRPYQSELRVKEYRQYKAVYCQLCRTMRQEYGWLSTFSLNYDCTFYAMLALAVSGNEICEQTARCAANPLKKCRYLAAGGDEYRKAAALSVLLTFHKLNDDCEDEGFFKRLACKLLLPIVRPKAKKAGENYPFLAQEAEKAMLSQAEAERNRAGIDACAEPTAALLAAVFEELSDSAERPALRQFGYYLGRWIYLMDAADDLEDDCKEGKFNPFLVRFGLNEKRSLTPEELKTAERSCNEVLNFTAAQMLPPLQLLTLHRFAPIIENVAEQGVPEMQREILFLHVKKEKRQMRVKDRI